MRRIAFMGLAFAVAAGCSGDDGGDGPSLTDGPYADTVDAFCGLLDRCPDLLGFPLVYRSRNECKLIIDFSIACELVEEREDEFTIRRRPIEVDQELADACIAWLEEVGCEDFGGEDSPCAAIFTFEDGDASGPTGGLDDECYGDSQCGDDFYCTPGGVDTERFVSVCQVCRPREDVGGPCGSSPRSCADGLWCGYDEASASSVCMAPKPDDADCTADDQCVSGYCNFDRDPLGGRGLCDPGGNPGDPCEERCRYENWCDAGTCQARKAAGESCTDSDECRSFGCNDGLCGSPDGGACSEDADCIGGNCVVGVCGGIGDGSCYDDEQCPNGEICLWDSDRCVAPQPNGSSCRRPEECASSFCSDDTETCSEPLAIGDPCSMFSSACGPTAYCRDGACAPLADPGESCGAVNGCKLPFLCQDGRCQLPNLTCAPASAGEQCALFRVCDDESWCDFVGGVVCRPRFRIGEECQPSMVPGIQVCQEGSRCLANELGELLCLAQGLEGEACGAAGCVDGTYCDAGTCVAGDVGRACDPWSPNIDPCPEPLVCGYDAEVCIARIGEGERCRESYECQDGLYCDFQCTARKGSGEECRETQECLEDLFCEYLSGDRSDTCVARLPVGSECDSREEPCVAGAWCPPGITACERLVADGGECDRSEQCLSGVCSNDYPGICLAQAACVLPD